MKLLEPAARLREQSTWLELDQAALVHNLSELNRWAMPGAEVLAVIKANAYGHGLLPIAKTLANDVAYFGVATVQEALALREAGIEIPILLFGMPFSEVVEAAIRARVALSISAFDQAREISEIAQKMAVPAIVHIKVDTGMGRLGLPQARAVEEIARIATLKMLQMEGLYTHFALGEEEGDSFTEGQIRGFNRILARLATQGIHFAYRHAANSVGIMNYREAHFNLIRPGISLYGISASTSGKRRLALRSVLAWRARLILLKSLKAGESSGYGRTFRAEHDTTIGIVPVGYSHGYPYALSNKGVVLFKGKPYPVVGRVSMDYMAVDFGAPHVSVQVGDVVTLLGRDGGDEISAEWIAHQAKTIPYEVVTQIHPSISRVIV